MRKEIVLNGNIECWNCGIHYSHRNFRNCPDCGASLFQPEEPRKSPQISHPSYSEIPPPIRYRRASRRPTSRVELIDDEIEPIELPSDTDIQPIREIPTDINIEEARRIAAHQIEASATILEPDFGTYGIFATRFGISIVTSVGTHQIPHVPDAFYIISPTVILVDSRIVPGSVFTDSNLSVSIEGAALVTNSESPRYYRTFDDFLVPFPNVCRITHLTSENHIIASHIDATEDSGYTVMIPANETQNFTLTTTNEEEDTILPVPYESEEEEEDIPYIETEEFEEDEEEDLSF